MSAPVRPIDEIPRSKITKASLQKAKKIFSYIKPYKGYFFLGIISLVFSSITVMALPKGIGSLVDVSLGKESAFLKNRNEVAILLAIIMLSQGVFSFLRVWFFAQVNERALANIRKDLYNKIICLPIPFFENTRVGELNSRITNDVAALQDTLSLTLAEFFRQIAILILGLHYCSTQIFI